MFTGNILYFRHVVQNQDDLRLFPIVAWVCIHLAYLSLEDWQSLTSCIV